MDFDQYSREVRDADVGFVLTHRETANWRLIRTEMRSVSLQFGSDGGGSISDGITRNDAAVLIWRVGASPEDIYLNGGLIGNDDLVVLEPSSHFIFASKGPRQWISVALPVCYFGAELAALGSSTRAIILSSPGKILTRSC